MLPLRTIGYEGCRIDGLLSCLATSNVEVLIDVRALPLSRKPGFSKRQLAAALDGHNIVYVHLRGLGTPKPGRDAARAGRTAEMRRIFEAHLRTSVAQADLEQARALAASRSCCLLCFEADHRDCHRDLVASRICDANEQPVDHLRAVVDAATPFQPLRASF